MRQQRFGVQVFRSHTCNSPNRGKCQPELSPLLNPAWIGVWGCCAWRLWNRSSTAPQTEIVHRHRNTRADWDETKKTMCPSLESSRIFKKIHDGPCAHSLKFSRVYSIQNCFARIAAAQSSLVFEKDFQATICFVVLLSWTLSTKPKIICVCYSQTSPVNGGPKSLPAQTSFEQGSLLVNQVALLDSRLSPASRWSSKLMKLWKLHYYTNSFKIQPPIQSNHVHSIPRFCHLQILGLSLPISVAPP